MDFLQNVYQPQQSTKARRPSGEDTAECSIFFTTIQNKRTRCIFIYSVFYKEIKNPVTGSRAPSLSLCLCLLVCLSFGLFVFWSVCLLVCLSFGLFVFWSVCLLVCLSFGLLVFWSLCLLISLSFGLYDALYTPGGNERRDRDGIRLRSCARGTNDCERERAPKTN